MPTFQNVLSLEKLSDHFFIICFCAVVSFLIFFCVFLSYAVVTTLSSLNSLFFFPKIVISGYWMVA